MLQVGDRGEPFADRELAGDDSPAQVFVDLSGACHAMSITR